MKKIISILALTFLLFSCSSNTPEGVAKSFSESLAKGKLEDAKEYATESTGKLLDMMSAFGGAKINPNFKFEMIKDSIVENKAWVTIKDEKKGEKKIELVKLDGKWLVHLGGKK